MRKQFCTNYRKHNFYTKNTADYQILTKIPLRAGAQRVLHGQKKAGRKCGPPDDSSGNVDLSGGLGRHKRPDLLFGEAGKLNYFRDVLIL